MAALATVADVEALLGRTLTLAESNHVTTMLDSASEAVREAAGQQFTRATSTVTLPVSDGTRLVLPQRPVVSVQSVSVDGTTDTSWALVSGELRRAGGWMLRSLPGRVTVTYTHGYAAVPRPVRDLVATLAVAAMEKASSGALGSGARQEAISGDSYSVTYAAPKDATISPFELPDRTRQWLRQSYGHGDAYVAVSR